MVGTSHRGVLSQVGCECGVVRLRLSSPDRLHVVGRRSRDPTGGGLARKCPAPGDSYADGDAGAPAVQVAAAAELVECVRSHSG